MGMIKSILGIILENAAAAARHCACSCRSLLLLHDHFVISCKFVYSLIHLKEKIIAICLPPLHSLVYFGYTGKIFLKFFFPLGETLPTEIQCLVYNDNASVHEKRIWKTPY